VILRVLLPPLTLVVRVLRAPLNLILLAPLEDDLTVILVVTLRVLPSLFSTMLQSAGTFTGLGIGVAMRDVIPADDARFHEKFLIGDSFRHPEINPSGLGLSLGLIHWW
jgi:hypothetical protein